MSDLPRHVHFHEEGPREGFQIERGSFPLEQRAALVDALSETGLEEIQVASFVSPKAVPQMADSEALFAAIRRRPGVRYDAVWLNERGYERARAAWRGHYLHRGQGLPVPRDGHRDRRRSGGAGRGGAPRGTHHWPPAARAPDACRHTAAYRQQPAAA